MNRRSTLFDYILLGVFCAMLCVSIMLAGEAKTVWWAAYYGIVMFVFLICVLLTTARVWTHIPKPNTASHRVHDVPGMGPVDITVGGGEPLEINTQAFETFSVFNTPNVDIMHCAADNLIITESVGVTRVMNSSILNVRDHLNLKDSRLVIDHSHVQNAMYDRGYNSNVAISDSIVSTLSLTSTSASDLSMKGSTLKSVKYVGDTPVNDIIINQTAIDDMMLTLADINHLIILNTCGRLLSAEIRIENVNELLMLNSDLSEAQFSIDSIGDLGIFRCTGNGKEVQSIQWGNLWFNWTSDEVFLDLGDDSTRVKCELDAFINGDDVAINMIEMMPPYVADYILDHPAVPFYKEDDYE